MQSIVPILLCGDCTIVRSRYRSTIKRPNLENARNDGMKNRLTSMLDIEHPLIQAPMAGVQGSALALAFGSRAALAQIELKLGHVGEPGSLFQKSGDEFAKRANAKLAGKATVTVFGSSQLGGDKELLQKLKLGTVDFAIPSTVMSSEVDLFGIFEMGWYFNRYLVVSGATRDAARAAAMVPEEGHADSVGVLRRVGDSVADRHGRGVRVGQRDRRAGHDVQRGRSAVDAADGVAHPGGRGVRGAGQLHRHD